MKKVLSVRAPRNHVGLNSRARERTFTEKRCNSRFCWTACERCRLLVPLPLRKMERQTWVFLIRSNSVLMVVAMDYAFTNSGTFNVVERSTIKKPSSDSHTLNQGSGWGAGPATFIPSVLKR